MIRAMRVRWSLALLAAGLCATGCRGPRLELKHQVVVGGSVTNDTFRNSLAGQLRTAFLPGNYVEPLLNGDQYFPSMIAAIRSATNTINIETFIWKSG